MPSVNIVEYGNYTTPQVINVAGLGDPSPPQILGSWWYDFSRIPEANIDLFMGMPLATFTAVTSFYPILGIFILPDGDPVLADLFGSIVPDVVISDPAFGAVTVFNGFDAQATIANPGVKRQVVLAYTIGTHGTSNLDPTTWKWRSLLLEGKGV